MGCSQSSESKEGKARNEEIENQLKRDKLNQRNEIKMLLLGAGESGKSTILKQMKLIHEGGYSRDERESFREVCKDTCYDLRQETDMTGRSSSQTQSNLCASYSRPWRA